ncbi:rRNA methyltransferase 3, mitochondrial [Cotesia glomerata]|uniref:rRNA methyltransferase 3, mitochondrial n=1 Tax=Cotesia glomerata TaxID=32391 RepID=A0AAV7IGV3_COTGL|nr:rRNA methyltransferase 3, mitochondrial [Cotesia glomerata]KAH0552253.1 hypothetical protein KQX54_007722 [Cotesia glomerata]
MTMLLNGIRMTIKCLQSSNQRMTVSYLPRVQNYSDWFHRQPKRIVNEEELLDYAEAADGPNEFLESDKKIKPTRAPLKVRPNKRQIKKKLKVTPSDTKFKEDGSLNFVELTETDRTLTMLMMSVRSRKTRDRNSKIILEGARMINDAIDAGLTPEIILFSRNPDVEKLSLPQSGVKLFKAPYRAIQTWSTLVTSPGLMGFFVMPDTEKREPAPDALPVTIVCDNVRDPGNLGSILRAAAAVGCKKFVTLKGCVDIWDPKVLKSAAGAHFRMPIFASQVWDNMTKFVDPDANIYVADHSIEDTAPVDELADHEVVEAQFNADIESALEDNEDSLEVEEENKKKKKTYQQVKHETELAKELKKNIPVIPYYATDYTKDEIVIIVGGETEGLSLEAVKLINDKFGVRVNIPMTNGVDSLNSSMALGIIAFEIRRQFALRAAKKNFKDSEEKNDK